MAPVSDRIFSYREHLRWMGHIRRGCFLLGANVSDWKWIDGYEGIYKISDHGEIMSMPRRFRKKERLLSLFSDINGYRKVNLAKEGNFKTYFVHRLVALTFLELPIEFNDKKFDVNHKDGNKSNNNVSNLEWVDRKQNVIHSFVSLGRKPSYGRKRFTKEQVQAIRQDQRTINEISESYHCSGTTIFNVKHGRGAYAHMD